MSEILHVSDTALMVAACRAMSYAADPFAARLAGERGMAIARALPMLKIMCFGVETRSRFLDELVMHAVTELGVRVVVNLGAGLDTRPWRMELPPELRWIEVDFAAILEYKSGLMADVEPKCRLTQRPADLADEGQRRAVFAAAGDGPGLLITEGVLMYLPASVVTAVATAPGGSWHWLTDITSAAMARGTGLSDCDAVEQVRADSHLTGEQILGVLGGLGWSVLQHRSYMPGGESSDPSGVTLFTRAA